LGGVAAMGSLGLAAATRGSGEGVVPTRGEPLPPGVPLRVKPLLVFQLNQPRERTSWRAYGGLKTRADVDQEAKRIGDELETLRAQAGFPITLQAVALVGSAAEAATAAGTDCDAFVVFASGGPQQWLETLAASKKPNVLFVRHKSGPIYLYYEIAHWRLLRKSEDTFREPNLDADDVVVDDYGDVLWRLRALYGLKNARGTRMLAVGGLAAYSGPGQQLGPTHAKEVWGSDVKTVTHEELAQKLRQARADAAVMRDVTRQADDLVSEPGVTLKTDKKSVVNSFLALRVFKDLMREAGAANLGVAHCMGGLIPILDTPPCLVLSLLNDEGLTGFCHTDFTHTLPGVLLRWISGKPSFICNSHFPHHGMVTLAHCAAPRKMNGRDYEPTTLMTHFESDYGAATKVEYRKGQTLTCLVPNLRCTKWQAFRGAILDAPAYDICRSQMDVAIEGDWRRLVREMEGFHTVVCYGDYLREVGYALKKLGSVQWENVSREAEGRAAG
jgi:L-fucose isomerase-like protein